MLIKVTSFHVYTHQDNTADTVENCSICELAVQNQNSEFTFVAILLFVFASTLIITEKKPIPFSIKVTSTFYRHSAFGRPPPLQA